MCGKEGDYLRHNIVPHCYRSLFPEAYKSHLSHDVVLVCQACKQVGKRAGEGPKVRGSSLGKWGGPQAVIGPWPCPWRCT